MRFRTFLLAVMSLLLIAAPASAKGKKAKKQMDPQQMMETYKQLAMPGEPHKQLASLVGTWDTKTKEWMDPSKPPMESTGTCEEKTLADGRFLQQDCTGQMMGQPFTGTGVIGYDNMKKKYVTTWLSSMGTGIFMMEGTADADGKTVTLKGSHPDPFAGVMHHRAIWKIVDSNTQIFEMYGAYGHDKEMKMMEITYTRKS
jgi:hypothetical protein